MIKLGAIKKRKERIRFQDWVKNSFKPGKYPITLILPPAKYPSFAIVFSVDEKTEVKMTIGADKFKAALKGLGVPLRKADLPTLDLIFTEEDYGLELNSDLDYILKWNGKCWKKEKITEDLPIDFETF
jgi:hypothetical protein